MPTQESTELIKYLKANLLIQLETLNNKDDNNEKQKPEILLNRAGFSLQEIADLIGKNYEAVKKTISRAK